jgi:hypothetical protein
LGPSLLIGANRLYAHAAPTSFGGQINFTPKRSEDRDYDLVLPSRQQLFAVFLQKGAVESQ